MDLKVEITPDGLPTFWDREVIFFANIHSLFFDNIELAKVLDREIRGGELGSRLPPPMIMAALAWNLKAWFGLFIINHQRGIQVIKMEFRKFLNSFILNPTQIIRTGRQIKYRILGYNEWLVDFMAVWERIRKLKLA